MSYIGLISSNKAPFPKTRDMCKKYNLQFFPAGYAIGTLFIETNLAPHWN